jgi:hypothetical protein
VLDEFRRHESAYDRALWLFLSREADFKRAEEIAFAKFYQGNKRYWNGFVVPVGLPLQRDEMRLARFGTGIRDAYATLGGSGDHVDIDLYEHEGSDVTQVSMYIADLSDVALEFEGPHLTSRERQLAREAAVLYSSEMGALDVSARVEAPSARLSLLCSSSICWKTIGRSSGSCCATTTCAVFDRAAPSRSMARTEFTSRFAAFASSRGMGAVADSWSKQRRGSRSRSISVSENGFTVRMPCWESSTSFQQR